MSHQPLTELMPLERIHTVAPDMSKTHKKSQNTFWKITSPPLF